MVQSIPEEEIANLALIDLSNTKIDLAKAVKLRNQGLTYKDIGVHFGCTRQAVQQALKPLMPTNNGVGVMKEHSLDLLRGKGYWLHESLTQEEIKDLSPRDKLTGIGIIHDKILQEERKDAAPAVNINILGSDIDKLNIQINQLEQSIGLNTDDMSNTGHED